MTREEAIQIIENMPISHECREFFGLFLEALKQQEVIRCKDCEMNNQCSIQFKFADADAPGDWFCAYAKRKKG